MSDGERHEPHRPAARGGVSRHDQAGVNGTARPAPKTPPAKPLAGWGLSPSSRKTLCVALVVLGTLLLLSTGVAGKDVAIFTSGGMVFVGVMGLALALVFDKIGSR